MLLFAFFYLLHPGFLSADSIYVKKQKFDSSISGSAVGLSNWNGESFKCLTFYLVTDYYYSVTDSQIERLFTGRTELGYSWLIDSLWKKNVDQLNLQYTLKQSGKKISRSVNAGLCSRLLTGYSYEEDVVLQKSERKWNGTFFNPSALELGYGMSYKFWEYSHFNLSLASARLRMEPAVETFKRPGQGTIGKTSRGWLLFDYGLSGQLLVNKSFSPSWEWNSTGKFFLKGFDKKNMQVNVSNTMSYKFLKSMELRADLKWIYDPLVSLRMQYRNELMMGFFMKFEK